MQNKNRRHGLLINPKFQLKIISLLLGVGLISGLAYESLSNYFFGKMLNLGHQAGLPTDHIYYSFIQTQQTQFKHYSLIFIVCLSLISGIFGLWLSHKIAGPLYRISTDIDRILNGESVANFKVRKGDYFPEMADKLNQLRDHLLKSRS